MSTYRVLTGPTASGKTSLLLALGVNTPLLVISADSRQIYQHMDIGTAKPSVDDLKILPHCGTSILKPSENFSAFQFLQITARCLREARLQDRQVWVSGGTGLYVRALLERLQLGIPPRPALRAALETRLREIPVHQAAAELKLDVPDPHNPARVIRYAELACQDPERAEMIYGWAGAGRYIDDHCVDPQQASDWAEPLAELKEWTCAAIASLDLPRNQLLANIERRTKQMYHAGLIEEVAHLRQLGYGECPVVKEGIGYREAAEVMDGTARLDSAIERTIIRTRQYAKRQRTYIAGRGWPTISPDQFSKWLSETESEAASD